MKKRILVFQLFIMALFISAHAQSVNEISYTSPNNPTATNLSALLVRFSNGTGYARLHYTDTKLQTEVILKLDIKESPYITASGVSDPDAFIVTTFNPTRINGGAPVTFVPDSYVFHTDSTNRYFDPWKVYHKNKNQEAVLDDFSSPPKSITADLMRPYVKKYFVNNEALYTQYVSNDASRGDDVIKPGTGITLYLIIVAATEDAKIGKSDKRDIENLKYIYRNIRRVLGFSGYREIILDGMNYDKKKISDTINSLNPGKNDIVAFHFTGHGINDMKPNHDYPNMLIVQQAEDWKRIADLPSISLSIEEIYKTIVKKGARLNLVFSDCCNSNLLVNKDYQVGHLGTTGRDEGSLLDPEKCKKLFIDEKTSILGIAARKSEYGRPGVDGGIFTYSFVQSLTANLSAATQTKKQLPKWKNVIDTTIAKTNYYIVKVCTITKEEPCPFQMTPYFNVGPVKPVPQVSAHKK